MDKVAALESDERSQLFQETASDRGMSAAIVEKDFWVCWVLKRIFSDSELSSRIVFKGGTSLSKVFGLIERFSEDVDLILDWRLIGYGPGQKDPFKNQPSKTQQDRFNAEFNERAATYIGETLCPQLRELFALCPQVSVGIDPNQHQVVNVEYPAAFPLEYLRPQVRLEIGPLASFVPHDSHMIQPYAAQSFPEVFDNPDCPVIAIDPERTFWEKATILHQQAHRTNTMPSRYSRHYYDMYCLANSKVKNKALNDLELLKDVVDFKRRFYPSPWAGYEDARPGTFRLVPKRARLDELERDYGQMEVMIFGEVPRFRHIVDTLRLLEKEINQLIPSQPMVNSQ
jgi:hypothetical protein